MCVCVVMVVFTLLETVVATAAKSRRSERGGGGRGGRLWRRFQETRTAEPFDSRMVFSSCVLLRVRMSGAEPSRTGPAGLSCYGAAAGKLYGEPSVSARHRGWPSLEAGPGWAGPWETPLPPPACSWLITACTRGCRRRGWSVRAAGAERAEGTFPAARKLHLKIFQNKNCLLVA